jgi:DNA-binding NarL/FixJ family response regulator
MRILIFDGEQDALERFREACPEARVVFTAEIDELPQGLAAETAETVQRRRSTLTGRQLDVLRLIGKGLANKEIAERLRIAQDTVKQHARAVYAILGVSSRTQAVSVAARRGLRLE